MKILNKLTIKHLKSNKKRTIVTIIGIILSTALMVGIGLLFSTIRDNSIKNIIESNGSHHVVIKAPESKLDQITSNKNIKNYKYSSTIGYSTYPGIKTTYKPYLKVQTASDDYLKELKIISGRLPKNNQEIAISSDFLEINDIDLKINDQIELNIGKRISDGIPLEDSLIVYEETTDENGNYEFQLNEEIINSTYHKYTIVGIIEADPYEDNTGPGYTAFTIEEPINDLYIYVEYNKPQKAYEYTKTIASSLGYKEIMPNVYDEITFNQSLLMMYGASSYSNVFDSITSIIIIILSLVSIACIIVIYNSFAISVMERKKQFGLFSSIGATRKQLKYTVFFEALIVGLIGIPLGVASAYLGIGIVLMIINKLLPEFLGFPLSLATYPIFLIIPIIFMILTIIISAYLPAKRASKVSPIEAIRLNDEIKIKSKKLKTPKFITKLFGVEGEIAYKNMKRNKKKYRITIISLFISIVLFVSFSGLLKYGLRSATDFTEMPSYEYEISANTKIENKKDLNKIINQISKVEGIKEKTIIKQQFLYTDYNKKYFKESNDYSEITDEPMSVRIITFDDESYQKYKQKLGIKDNRPILLNIQKNINYENGMRKQEVIYPYNPINNLEVYFYDYLSPESYSNKYQLENIYIANELPFGIDNTYDLELSIIVDEETFDKIFNDKNNPSNKMYDLTMRIKADSYDKIDKLLTKDSEENILNDNVNIYTWNIYKEMKTFTNAIIVLKILLYGFIALVTLIGVTSVINTINTSMALRKKEFAVLRSIGLTPKGFNKMLLFECFLFGFKSLLYSIPVSIGIIYLFHRAFGDLVTLNNLLIPYDSILIATISVFIIVLISMMYATSKIKKANILDAIREENI